MAGKACLDTGEKNPHPCEFFLGSKQSKSYDTARKKTCSLVIVVQKKYLVMTSKENGAQGSIKGRGT